MRTRTTLLSFVATGLLGVVSSVYAVDPNPLENAYWRFEEGTAGAPVPEGGNTVLDSINENHMQISSAAVAPLYTTDVPVAVIPQTGQSNALALHFSPNRYLHASGKNINNPLVDAMTVEAAFKPESVVDFQGIIGKDGKPSEESPLQTWILKIRADNSNLQVEFFDKHGAIRSVQSFMPLTANQWYYAAVVADDTTCSLYLDRNDGAGYVFQGATEVMEGPIWQGPTRGDFTTNWTIGRGMYNNTATDYFRGVIDEVRISNTALDPDDFLFTLRLPGDFNFDGRVDEADFMIFQACATGEQVPYDPEALPPGCTLVPDAEGRIPADFDRDGDVDMDDFGVFQVHYTG